MASYMELKTLFGHSDLQDKVEVACIVAAEAIRVETPEPPNHADRVVWAKRCWASSTAVRDELLKAVLAANKDQSVEDIIGAADSAIQARVDAAVDVFADGS